MNTLLPIVRCAILIRSLPLGVILYPKFSVVPHVHAVVQSAHNILGFIIRNYRGFNNISILELLYYPFIRSCLDYGSFIWNPVYIYSYHVDLIISVQRRFLKNQVIRSNDVYSIQILGCRPELKTFSMIDLESTYGYNHHYSETTKITLIGIPQSF